MAFGCSFTPRVGNTATLSNSSNYSCPLLLLNCKVARRVSIEAQHIFARSESRRRSVKSYTYLPLVEQCENVSGKAKGQRQRVRAREQVTATPTRFPAFPPPPTNPFRLFFCTARGKPKEKRDFQLICDAVRPENAHKP